jgi:hypothetical protein
MGGTCGTHGGGKRCLKGFGWEVRRDHREDLGIGGRITLSWTVGRQGSMGRIGFGWLRIGYSGGRL